MFDTYCEAWPTELKEIKKQGYRAQCKLRCLTAALDHTNPRDFDALMDQIEAAQDELYRIAAAARKLKQRRDSEHSVARVEE